MAQLNTRIILRNDSSVNWEVNADQVLLKGEVGIEFLEDGTPKIKIGDGITAWNDLPYQGENSVVNASTHYDFPSIGRVNAIYKAEQEKLIYQWNPDELKYEQLGFGASLEINLINGGNAND